jgi:hypothetical protein
VCSEKTDQIVVFPNSHCKYSDLSRTFFVNLGIIVLAASNKERSFHYGLRYKHLDRPRNYMSGFFLPVLNTKTHLPLAMIPRPFESYQASRVAYTNICVSLPAWVDA